MKWEKRLPRPFESTFPRGWTDRERADAAGAVGSVDGLIAAALEQRGRAPLDYSGYRLDIVWKIGLARAA